MILQLLVPGSHPTIFIITALSFSFPRILNYTTTTKKDVHVTVYTKIAQFMEGGGGGAVATTGTMPISDCHRSKDAPLIFKCTPLTST